MLAPDPNPVLPRTAADVLWAASGTLLAIMPVAMVVANRSSIAFLVVPALCAVAGAALDGRLRLLKEDIRGALATPLGLSVLAFFAWSALSATWSELRDVTFHYLGEFWLPVAASFVLGVLLPPRRLTTDFWVFAGCIALACVVVLYELGTNLADRGAMGMRTDTFIFNRSTLTILLVAIPLAAWSYTFEPPLARLCGAAVLALCILTLALSESGAALLGILVAVLTWLLAWFAPRLAVGLAAIAFIVVMAAAPVAGPLSERFLPAGLHAWLASSHSRERVDIWNSYGSVIRKQPWLGAGFGVSARIAETAAAERVVAEQRALLAMRHPHNGALQVWTELGAAGALLAAAVALATLYELSRLPSRELASGLALLGFVTSVWLVGHGAWQGWWAAAVGATIVWLLRAHQRERRSRSGY